MFSHFPVLIEIPSGFPMRRYSSLMPLFNVFWIYFENSILEYIFPISLRTNILVLLLLLLIILIPVIEIFLFIKIGSQIGAITTVLLIFATAILGVYYAKYEGLNTLKAGFVQLRKNEKPTYEMISGAAIAFAALLLIIPGFVTDVLGFLLIFPITRKFFFGKFAKKFKTKNTEKNNFIDGDFEDIEDNDDKKI